MISLSISIPALEGKKINLDIPPEEVFQGLPCHPNQDFEQFKKLLAETRGNLATPFVDVWNFQCVLAFMVFDEDGTVGHVERLTEDQQTSLGITAAMIKDAVYEHGALNMSGHYPISDEIRAKLAEGL